MIAKGRNFVTVPVTLWAANTACALCGFYRRVLRLHSRGLCGQEVVGTDVSSWMVETATRRLKGLSNASVQMTTGQDLSAFVSGSMDLVYSVDTFPYLMLSGHVLVERYFCEIRRVLRPGGDFVLFNYAYGRAREDANGEVLALAHGAQGKQYSCGA
jgi:cyclopropane fatty-acyl-phospholipid synthase-like methyltransferase